MKDLNNKFLSLLRYFPYLVDEKPKVQQFLSCLPYHIKDRIGYDNPKTLEEAIGKLTSVLNRIRRRKACPTGKLRKIITSMNKRRRILCPT